MFETARAVLQAAAFSALAGGAALGSQAVQGNEIETIYYEEVLNQGPGMGGANRALVPNSPSSAMSAHGVQVVQAVADWDDVNGTAMNPVHVVRVDRFLRTGVGGSAQLARVGVIIVATNQTNIDGLNQQPLIAMDLTGSRFVVAWMNNAGQIEGALFDGGGVELDRQVLVADTTISGTNTITVENLHSLEMRCDGRFAIAWNSMIQPAGSGSGGPSGPSGPGGPGGPGGGGTGAATQEAQMKIFDVPGGGVMVELAHITALNGATEEGALVSSIDPVLAWSNHGLGDIAVVWRGNVTGQSSDPNGAVADSIFLQRISKDGDFIPQMDEGILQDQVAIKMDPSCEYGQSALSNSPNNQVVFGYAYGPGDVQVRLFNPDSSLARWAPNHPLNGTENEPVLPAVSMDATGEVNPGTLRFGDVIVATENGPDAPADAHYVRYTWGSGWLSPGRVPAPPPGPELVNEIWTVTDLSSDGCFFTVAHAARRTPPMEPVFIGWLMRAWSSL